VTQPELVSLLVASPIMVYLWYWYSKAITIIKPWLL